MKLSCVLLVCVTVVSLAFGLPAMARNAPLPVIGFGVEDTTGSDGSDLVRVTNVQPGSLADRAGLRPGSMLWYINGKRPFTAAQVGELLQAAWLGDAPSLTLAIHDFALRANTTISIAWPAELAAVAQNDTGDSMTIQLPKSFLAMAPSPLQEAMAPVTAPPTASENAAGANGTSPPFVELDFLCRVDNGIVSADRSGKYWHQVLRGDTRARAESANLYYDELGTGFQQGQSTLTYHGVDQFVYEIACQGGNASAAQLSVLTGAVVDGPIQSQFKSPPLIYYRDGSLTAGKNHLAAGVGIGPPMPMTRFPHWDVQQNTFTFPVIGSLPAHPPAAPVPLLLTRVFSIAAPWLQLFVGLLCALISVSVLLSYKPLPAKTVAGPICLAIAFLALTFCLTRTTAPSDPASLQAAIDLQMQAARTNADEIDRLRSKITALTPIEDRRVMPIKAQDMEFVQTNATPKFIPPVLPPPNPDRWIWLLLAPIGAFLAFGYRAFLGATYFLTPHAPTDIIQPILSTGSAIYPNTAILDALDTPIEDIITPPPLRHTQSMIARGRELMHRIKQDREISEASAERDMARADMLEARERIRQAKAKLPWWRRWFT